MTRIAAVGVHGYRYPVASRLAVGLLVLLSGCQAPAAQVSPTHAVPLARRALTLLRTAAEVDDPIVRANAIEALVDVDPQHSVELFRAAAAADSKLVRYAGLVALGDVRDRASLPVIRRLLKEPDAHVRIGAAYADYRCGKTGAARVLVTALTNSPDEKVRADAAYLIGKLGEKKALKRLKLALRREKVSYVQVHIVSAMAMLGDDESIDALIYYTQSDITSRLIALQTLDRLAAPRARAALHRLLDDKQTYVQIRLLAARALARLGDRAGYALAAESLRRTGQNDDETMQIRVNAALALGAMRQNKALPLLEKLAAGEHDARVQVAAAYAICQITR